MKNSTILLAEIRVSTEDILSNGGTIRKIVLIFLASLLGDTEDISSPLTHLVTLGIFVKVDVIGDTILLIGPSVIGLHIAAGGCPSRSRDIGSTIGGSLVRHFGSLSTRNNTCYQQGYRQKKELLHNGFVLTTT
jgi:hypothetical protein